MFKKGDVVVVVGTYSTFDDLLGAFGVVKEVGDVKSLVIFYVSVKGKGGMAHTVLNEELIKIGEVYKFKEGKICFGD